MRGFADIRQFIRPGRRRKVLLAICLLSCLYLFGSLLAAWFLLLPRNRNVPPPPADFRYPVETVEFCTSDQIRLRGWFLDNLHSDKTLILLHGYRESRAKHLQRAAMFCEAGYDVLLYDARGCGDSQSTRISAGHLEQQDLLAALDFVEQRGASQVACLGISQGGATILLAASALRGRVVAVIAESTYPDIANAVARRLRLYTRLPGYQASWLMMRWAEWLLGVDAGMMSPAAQVAQLDCPLFVVSGTRDSRTFEEDTRRLFAAAGEPRELWLVEGANHEDLYSYAPEKYKQRVLDFLTRAFTMSPR